MGKVEGTQRRVTMRRRDGQSYQDTEEGKIKKTRKKVREKSLL